MRNLVLGLAVCIGFALPVSAADDAAAVLKKAIEAHGGAEALTTKKSGEYKVKGDMTVAGSDISFTGAIVYEVPGKFRMQLDAEVAGQKIALLQIVNGDKVQNTLNGSPTKLGKAERAELLQAAAMQEISQLVPLTEGEKFTVKLEKDEEVDGKPASVVLVTAKNLKDIRLFFDKKSGLLVKSARKALAPGSTDEKQVLEESYFTDYKKVDGVMLPQKFEVKHDGQKFMTMSVVEASLKEKADPKKFVIED